jgi:alpha-1,2-mannosyltransferase
MQTISSVQAEQSLLLRRAAIAVAALAITVFCVKIIQLLWIGSLTPETDVGAYYEGAQRLRSGLPLYRAHMDIINAREQYVYPPLLALMFYPIASYQLAWWSWAVLSLVCWCAALGLLLRELLRAAPGQWLRRSIWWPVFLAALINFPPVLVHLTWGQLQLPLLLLLTLAWICLRRGREATAGILIGLAIALKLFPLLLVIPLALQRRWLCAAVALAIAAAVLIPSFAVVGWEQTSLYITKVLPEVSVQKDLPDNYSVAVSLRLVLGTEFPSEQVGLVLRVAAFGLVALAALRRPRDDGLILALGITALVWVPPVVWTHYFVLTYLSCFDALLHATRRIAGVLICAYFLIASASLIFYIPDTLVPIAHVLPVLGALTLLGVQLWLAFPGHVGTDDMCQSRSVTTG